MTHSIVLDIWLAMAAGILIDLILGDPQKLPHPVRLIGRAISMAEKMVRRLSRTKKQLRFGGIMLAVFIPLLMAALCFAILFGLNRLSRIWMLAGVVYFSYTAMGTTCLAREANRVAHALSQGLEAGRTQLSHIVGRDTGTLSEQEIIKATVETVAENTTDGSVSVMIYLLIGGPILAYFFKAVSTLDSMIGYRDERYIDIGWASAKFDDILNLIPARISGVVMAFCAGLCGLSGTNARKILKRDHANHLSPNCGWTEAAAAGALGIRLGGAHEYFGKTVEKQTIGDDLRPAVRKDIKRINRLMYATVLNVFLLLIGLCALIYRTAGI